MLVAEYPAAPVSPWDAVSVAASWFVLHVKSRQEKALCVDLSAACIRHYLPLNRSVRYYGRRKAHVIEPLFPCYVFVKGSRADTFVADRTRRVASILPVPNQAQFERELRQLKETLDRVGFLTPTPLLERGLDVEVMSGPFKGTTGKISSLEQRNRLVLQVSALGQGASLEIDGSLLRPTAD